MIQAYVLIGVEPGKEREVNKSLIGRIEVKKVNELFGEWDLIALVEVKEMEELDTFVTEKVRSLGEVRLTSTMVVAR